jgi:hypothetical protein
MVRLSISNKSLRGTCRTSWVTARMTELLPLSEFNHNNHVHSSMQQSPFMVNTGRNPHMGFEPQQPRLMMESVNNFVDHMAQGLDEAKAVLTKAKDK